MLGIMVIARNRWVRGAVVGQPVLAWPVALLVWSGGGPVALAAGLLWLSTGACVFGIVAPLHRQDRDCLP